MRHYNKHTTFKNRPKKSQLITGLDAVTLALREGEQIEKIFLDQRTSLPGLPAMKQLADSLTVPISKVPVEKLKSFNIEVRDGCVALKSKVRFQKLQDIINMTVDKGEVPFFLILDGITDVRNIGAIGRTAYSCGVDAIVIPDKGVGSLNEDAIATSAGALELLPVVRVRSLHECIDEMHLNGIGVFSSEMQAENSITDIDFKDPVAIILGSEDKGIQPSVMKMTDQQFNIPMKNNFESLNVSVAAGMICYEVMRQRSYHAKHKT